MEGILTILRPGAGDTLARLVFAMVLATWIAGLVASVVALRAKAPKQALAAGGGGIEDVEFQLTTLADRIAEATPPLLIMIGLLGTFVGIAMAIGHAHQAVMGSQGKELSETLASLGPMLGEIGVKFQSSAWGLLGSLSLRPFVFLLATRTRHRRAHDAFLELERQRSELEQQRSELERTKIAEIAKSTGDSAAVLVQFSAVLDRLNTAAEQLLQGARSSTSAAESLRTSLASLRDGVANAVVGAGDTTARAMNANQRVLGDVKGAVEKLETGLGASLEELRRRFEAAVDRSAATMRDSATLSAEKTATAITANGASVERGLQKLDGAVSSIRATLATSLAAVSTTMGDAISVSASKTEDALQANRTSMDGGLAKIGAAVDLLKSELKSATNESAKKLGLTLDKLSDRSEALAQSIAEQSVKASEQLVASQKQGVIKLDENLLKVSRSMETMTLAVSDMNDAVKHTNVQSVRMGEAVVMGASSNSRLVDAVDKLNRALGTISGDMAKASRSMEKSARAAASTPAPIPTEPTKTP